MTRTHDLVKRLVAAGYEIVYVGKRGADAAGELAAPAAKFVEGGSAVRFTASQASSGGLCHSQRG